MFAAPPEIETRVFTRMPDTFRRPDTETHWANMMLHGAKMDCFLEGPSFDRDGNLYVVDIPYGRIFKIAPDGTWTLAAEYDGEPNGLVMNLEETILYLAVTRDNSVWRVPLMADGRPTKVGVFVQLSGGLAGPDGMALDAEGNLAVAHAGLGTVWLFNRIGDMPQHDAALLSVPQDKILKVEDGALEWLATGA